MAELATTARVRPDDVQEIIETDLDDPVLNRYINSANRIVEDYLAGSTELSSEALVEIELYLSAHLLAITRERQVERESFGGDYSATYQGDTGEGLRATHYGQTALTLDTTGQLAKLAEGKKKASFTVWGDDD